MAAIARNHTARGLRRTLPRIFLSSSFEERIKGPALSDSRTSEESKGSLAVYKTLYRRRVANCDERRISAASRMKFGLRAICVSLWRNPFRTKIEKQSINRLLRQLISS
jgi:hypothetical protein